MEVFTMEKVCIIGSRTITDDMVTDLHSTLDQVTLSKQTIFSTGGCAGISIEAVKYFIAKGDCSKVHIWLAKKLENIPLVVKPFIHQAIKMGAIIIESHCNQYLAGIINRNKEMLADCNICNAYRLNRSLGTTHELNYAAQYHKSILLHDYDTLQLKLPLFHLLEK